LCEAHKSAIAGGHGHAADTAAATVAKRKVAPAPSKCWIVAMALAHPSGGSASIHRVTRSVPSEAES
jgi:hypothetical protein